MATLELTYADLMNAVGDFLGFGRDYTLYSATDVAICEENIQSGLRDFYYFRDFVDGVMFQGWSFVNFNPTSTLTLVSGTRTYTLPSNFSSIDGTFTWGDGINKLPILIVGDQNILDMYNAMDASGDPLYASIETSGSTGTALQTNTVTFYPEPNAAGALNYRYFINPLQVTSSATYPLGGPQHAETLKEACIAAAERNRDDEVGMHNARFQQLLMQSARFDMRAATPEYLGRNIDRSDYIRPVMYFS